ncbi:MAG: hypothetical protein HKL88_08490 [Bacteroidia bacterium]|nr:hypothetical protein [Bacteroidia bacterium]
MGKKVVIVSYTFPPATGVGGRRWSKLGEQLVKKGHEVHLVTASPSSSGKYGSESWNGLTVHRIPGNYPPILTHFDKKNLQQKINYRLASAYMKYFTKGNIYDRSIRWGSGLQDCVSRLIGSENITNIIASAPPYRYLFDITSLKKKFPELNVILDFRDPWAEHPDFHRVNMSSLPSARVKCEQDMERSALENADRVVAISRTLTQSLSGFMKGYDEKFVTITNGFDGADYAFLKNQPIPETDGFRIVYNGSLYLKTADTNQSITNYINNNRELLLKRKVTFEFCGHIGQENLAIFEKADKRIFKYYGVKPMNEALTILNQASAALFITDLGHEDIQFNTKLMDYIALRKKIFIIGPKGEVSDFITRNGIGAQFTNETIGDMLEWIMNNEKFEQLSYRNFDNSRFEFTNLATQFESLLV